MREDLKLRIANNVGNMTRGELSSVLDLVSQYEDAVAVGKAKTKFIDYVKYMWPGFIMGAHHKTFADIFERVLSGELKRVIINLPPRHSKSEFCSWLLPSYYLGRFPDKKLMQLSHTGELARSFGRKVRNTIDSQRYQNVFGGVSLRADSKSAGRWNTSKDGVYFANGVGGAVTGRGADLMIIDDPHSEQDAFSASATVYDNAYEWYTSGPRQRLQPGGSIILCMTRWHKRDMTGRLIKDSIERDGDVWEVVELPAILDTGVPLWPEFWSLEELLKLKAELPAQKWAAQYMQAPSKEEGALVKRAWWNLWEGGPPKISYIIMSIDTAYTKKTINDPSALTVWGVFTIDDDDGKSTENIILLDAHEMWEEFPDLKKKTYQLYKEWKPDSFLIEGKASGLPLAQEFRAMGIPVSVRTPVSGEDKITRVNRLSDMFCSGVVWYPNKSWAEKVVEQFAAFPRGEHDDLVDSSVQALERFRTGGWIRIESDYEEPVRKKKKVRRSYY